jgi:hypothetical protein
MTLHKAVELIKKVGIGMGIGLGIIVVSTFIFRFGVFIVKTVSPPKITPPNQALGELPAIEFPQNNIPNNFTYSLNTVTGSLPTDFPDRLIVYPLAPRKPSLLNLEKAKTKAQNLGFQDQQGKPIPEISLGNGKYEWSDPRGINRRLTFDIVTFDFTLTSRYLASLTTLGAQNLSTEQYAIETAKDFLDVIQLFPEDVDLTKTQTIQKNTSYDTFPKLFNILNGALVPTTSLSNAKVIRVDFHQKDIEYDLDTGRKDAPKIKMKLPIRYPRPPFSTMSFWISSGQNDAEVGAANFVHKEIEKSNDQATYPIKPVQTAFEELQEGKAYVASYSGLEQQIFISNVYLAYYIGEGNQDYLLPIIVFEGQDGFFAYVSAVKENSN